VLQPQAVKQFDPLLVPPASKTDARHLEAHPLNKEPNLRTKENQLEAQITYTVHKLNECLSPGRYDALRAIVTLILRLYSNDGSAYGQARPPLQQ